MPEASSKHDLIRLRALAEEATAGPWQANPFEYEVHTGANLTSFRIDTVWEHPQLKGPAPVIGGGISLRSHPLQPEEMAIQEVLYVREPDAKYIAAVSPEVVLALITEVERLRNAVETSRDEAAFEAGWQAAAEWAKREDLVYDIDSPAYRIDRFNRLKRLAVETGGSSGVSR